jgi:hypothetical protein
MTNPAHHHFSPEDLAKLEWSQPVSLDIKYEAHRGTRTDRVPREVAPGKTASLNGYHEAIFPIGADEVGYVLIPTTALELVNALRDVEIGETAAERLKELQR